MRVAFLTAGGIAPCLSSSLGHFIFKYNEKDPSIEMIAYKNGYKGLLLGDSIDVTLESRKKANKISNDHKKALEYSNKVLTKMNPIRYHCDKLELLVDNTLWPLAKYRELLFSC